VIIGRAPRADAAGSAALAAAARTAPRSTARSSAIGAPRSARRSDGTTRLRNEATSIGGAPFESPAAARRCATEDRRAPPPGSEGSEAVRSGSRSTLSSRWGASCPPVRARTVAACGAAAGCRSPRERLTDVGASRDGAFPPSAPRATTMPDRKGPCRGRTSACSTSWSSATTAHRRAGAPSCSPRRRSTPSKPWSSTSGITRRCSPDRFLSAAAMADRDAELERIAFDVAE
jgi:hypothetical protein